MRINPEIKAKAEQIYAECGMTLTDAVNAFLQQSQNVGGLPFLVTQNSREVLRNQAVSQLLQELKQGENLEDSEGEEAQKTLAQILKSCANLKAYPYMGGNLSVKTGKKNNLRYLICGGYILFYRVEDEEISFLLDS